MRVNFSYFLTIIALAVTAISAQAQAPVITSPAPSSPIGVNVAYSLQYTASGSPAPTYAVTSGALPPGLTLSSSGLLSGTPTTTNATAYTGTVTATNSAGTGTQNFSILVETAVLNTVPEGILTLDVKAGGSGGATSYISLPLTADPVYSGAISGVAANTISIAVDTNNPNPFVNPATGIQLANLETLPYFVKFLTGAQAGRVLKVTANTSNSSSATLTLDTTDNSTQTVDLTTSGFSVAAGDTFEVFPACTFGSLFGDNSSGNALQVKGAGSSILADTVSVYNPTASRFQVYFFNTTAGYWELSGSTANANNTVIYPYSALTITRRANGVALAIAPMAYVSEIATTGGSAANTLVPMSRVAEVPILTKAAGNSTTVYASTAYPVDMTLSQLMAASSYATNWKKANSVVLADTIAIYNTSTSHFDTYYQLSSDSTWRKAGDATTDQSNFVVPAGTLISIVQRNSGISGKATFLSSGLPYSVTQ